GCKSRPATAATNTRHHEHGPGKDQQNRPDGCATPVLNRADEAEAKRHKTEAQRDDTDDHDPGALRVECGEGADVLATGAVVILDESCEQPRRREDDGTC